GDDPANRTDKPFGRLAPVHAFLPVNAVDLFGEKLSKNLAGVATFFSYGGGEVFALRCGDLLNVSETQAGFLGKRVSRRRRLAVFVGDFERWPEYLLFNVGLRRCNSLGSYGEAPWRGESLNR